MAARCERLSYREVVGRLSVLIINKDRDSHGGIMINRLKTIFSVLFNDQGVKKMTTQVFETYEDFLARKDKNINGVSPDFTGECDDSNVGCWNCTDCTNCTNCTNCTDCTDCTDCKNCLACDDCIDCKK